MRVRGAGDAAHTHFPTGGVGLNVGLREVIAALPT
ncbi:FAD-dependent monooxygenase [Streptosporangium sp. NPDC002544]